MSEKFAIAHVDSERGFSGGEVQVMLLVEGLKARGYRNVIFCPPLSGIARAAVAAGVEAVAVRMRNEFDLPSVLRLARGIRSARADLVHLHTGRATWLGGLAAGLAGRPALATRRMDRPIPRNARTRFLYRRLVRKVAAISPGVARCLTDGGVPAGRIVTIPSAVDPERLRPVRVRDETRRALGAALDDVVVLVLAALTRRKGVDLLLEATAALRRDGVGCVLWIAGDGPELSGLREQAMRLHIGTQVRFLGRRDDKADLLAACDLLAMPSRREGLGVAALEAMAAGRPVLASRVGGLQDAVVDRRSGLLVTADDPAALAAALRELVCDAELRRRLGEAGPQRVAEGFLASQMVDSYEQLYSAILGGPGNGS